MEIYASLVPSLPTCGSPEELQYQGRAVNQDTSRIRLKQPRVLAPSKLPPSRSPREPPRSYEVQFCNNLHLRPCVQAARFLYRFMILRLAHSERPQQSSLFASSESKTPAPSVRGSSL